MVFGLFRSGPPKQDAVVRRLAALHAQVVHAIAMPPADLLAGLRDTSGTAEWDALVAAFGERAKESRATLEAIGAWRDMSDQERAFLSTPVGAVEPQQHVNAMWLMEGAACLLWSLGRSDGLPAWDTQADVALLEPARADTAPRPMALRPRAELERMRSIAELWHWRARTRDLMNRSEPVTGLPAGMTLSSIVAQSAAAAASDGAIAAVQGDDFPARGKAYRELTEDEFSEVRSIAMERHRALNWLCGMAPKNRWDDTPTDT